ncbi:hypothetical protein DM02DRAFT_368937 [Periconia macrospinosa]|uniref:Uncharacterized protein n=1 Tax=Periconia macrospinosa TaxID=97972 RepID=A0A2V1DSL4_9PLEO|nr:hypothetical protein DM02DRAFT_368937 [Periconia macrospinosa]
MPECRSRPARMNMTLVHRSKCPHVPVLEGGCPHHVRTAPSLNHSLFNQHCLYSCSPRICKRHSMHTTTGSLLQTQYSNFNNPQGRKYSTGRTHVDSAESRTMQGDRFDLWCYASGARPIQQPLFLDDVSSTHGMKLSNTIGSPESQCRCRKHSMYEPFLSIDKRTY